MLRKEEGSRKENRGEEIMTKGGRKNREEERGKKSRERMKITGGIGKTERKE